MNFTSEQEAIYCDICSVLGTQIMPLSALRSKANLYSDSEIKAVEELIAVLSGNWRKSNHRGDGFFRMAGGDRPSFNAFAQGFDAACVSLLKVLRDDALQGSEARKAQLKELRKKYRKCIMCGKSLSLFQKLFTSDIKHKRCVEFRES